MVRRTSGPLDALLATHTWDQFLAASQKWPSTLSLPEAQRLTAHLREIAQAQEPLRVAFVRTVTTDLLDPWLELAASVQGFGAETYHAPFGLNLSEAEAGSGLCAHAPDVTVVMLTRDDLHPEMVQPLAGRSDQDGDRIANEAGTRLLGVLARFRDAIEGQLLVTIVPSPAPPPLGLYDAQAQGSMRAWWERTKAAIAGRIRAELPSTLLLDMDEMVTSVGRSEFFDLRYWYTSRYPFAARGAEEVARRIIAIASVARSPRAKVIALDADNTLWGGVVGEEGLHGIALSPDYPGNAFVDFQRRLLGYQQRGLLLVLCSKNNPEDVDEVLGKHPHQVLKDEHFAARRVNWMPKTENLRAIAQELNLGLESFVFVDDSDHECGLIRQTLPMVTVVQTPRRPAEIPACLDRVARLEILSLTDEDRRKTRMYAEERKRRELKDDLSEKGADIGDYLRSLGMQMTVRVNDIANVKRLAQLTQKTNQFNLTTRRYDESQIQEFIDSDDHLVTSFSLRDVFGDSGIVGLAIMRNTRCGEAELDTFLMSCRAIGRQAESAFLFKTLELAGAWGAVRVLADYVPTRKNRLVEDFLPRHGFHESDSARYECELGRHLSDKLSALPLEVTVEECAVSG